MNINNLTIRTKFYLLIGVILSIFAISLLFIKSANDRIANNFNQFYTQNFAVSLLFEEVKDTQTEIMLNVRGLQIAYLLNLSNQVDGYVSSINKNMADTPQLLNALSKDFAGDATTTTKLRQVVTTFQNNSSAFIKAMENAPDNKAPFSVFSDYRDAYSTLNEFFNDFQKMNYSAADTANKDANNAISYANYVFYLSIIISVAIAVIFSQFLSKKITNSIKHVMDTAHALAKGKLNVSCVVNGKDEIAELSRALNTTIQNLNNTLSAINSSTQIVDTNSQTLLEANNNIQISASEVSDHTVQVVTAIEELTITSMNIADNTSESAQTSDTMAVLANKGIDSSNQTKDAVIKLVGNLNETANVVGLLKDESIRIESILDVIRNIAEQTNLLALNAAIEAARAGEQGRGFAVVADEVRTLAQRSQSSVNEIEAMLNQLSSACENAVKMMFDSTEIATSAEGKVVESNQMIEDILELIHQVNDQTQQIATAAEQQSAVATEISGNMHTVQELTQKSATICAETASCSDEMNQVSKQVLKQVQFFELG